MKQYNVSRKIYFYKFTFPLVVTIFVTIYLIFGIIELVEKHTIKALFNPTIGWLIFGGSVILIISLYIYSFYIEDFRVIIDDFKIAGKSLNGVIEEILFKDIKKISPSYHEYLSGTVIESIYGNSIFIPSFINSYDEILVCLNNEISKNRETYKRTDQ